ACGAPRACARSMQIIDSKGGCAPPSDIASFVGAAGATMSVVSILGGRGSGKSTLLNRAFGTDFEVGGAFQREASPGACAAVSESLLLLDCDGADEGLAKPLPAGGATAAITEAELAAFSGALCDAVIVNVWSSDVGRAVSSNVRMLKALFGEKVKRHPPPEDARTLMLLAVHDYDPSVEVSALEAAALQDLEAVWSELELPEGRNGAALADFFAVQVQPLAHPRYQPDAYAAAVAGLRSKLAGGARRVRTAGALASAAASAWEGVR
ncbi:unnamed protein product, partial [Phaeothamnion confervicola]